MTEWNTKALIEADKRFVWHPFTDMHEWCALEHEPLILVEGQGAVLRDSKGREYIDGNSSIWTNIHGHNWRRRHSRRHQVIAFRNSYHGDTAGAASLGAATMFQVGSTRWNFPAMQVPNIRALEALEPAEIAKIAAVVIEPLIQGAAGMRLWPPGTLRAVREWCNRNDTLLIVNEVMTGFGRTGVDVCVRTRGGDSGYDGDG